jgi:hypothetical protein
LRAQGHEGSKCWYPATRSTAQHDHQDGTTTAKPTTETPKAAAASQETYGFGGRLLSEAVPRELQPDGPASFAERFSAAYGDNANTDTAGYSPRLIVALTFFDGNSGHTKTARAMAGITAMKSSKLSWLGLDR